MPALDVGVNGLLRQCMQQPDDFIDCFLFHVVQSGTVCVVDREELACRDAALVLTERLGRPGVDASIRIEYAADWVEDDELYARAERIAEQLTAPYRAGLSEEVYGVMVQETAYRLVLVVGLVRFLGGSSILLSSRKAPVALVLSALGISPDVSDGTEVKLEVHVEARDGVE